MKHVAIIAFVMTLVGPAAQAWEKRTPQEIRDTIVSSYVYCPWTYVGYVVPKGINV